MKIDHIKNTYLRRLVIVLGMVFLLPFATVWMGLVTMYTVVVSNLADAREMW